jgi:hypothetical protein
MAPKRSAREPTPSTASHSQSSVTSTSTPSASKKSSGGTQSPAEIALGIWQNYLDKTPQRTKLIDTFMGFLVVVGVLQFVYCVIAGNYVSLDITLSDRRGNGMGWVLMGYMNSLSMLFSRVSRRRLVSLF